MLGAVKKYGICACNKTCFGRICVCNKRTFGYALMELVKVKEKLCKEELASARRVFSGIAVKDRKLNLVRK